MRERLVYLNHAGVAPLSRRAADAMKHLADDALEFGSLHYDRVAGHLRRSPPGRRPPDQFHPGGNRHCEEHLRGDFLHCHRPEMAGRRQNGGLPRRISSQLFPWRKLEENGVHVEWLSVFDPLEKIEQAVRGAQLLSISFVQYLSGYRAPIEAIGEICSRSNCIFVVDAIQGLGAFPLDVRKCNIDALAADGHKWMLGPEGCGILYVSEKLQDRIDPDRIRLDQRGEI